MATLGPVAVKTTEGILTAADGQKLYTKAWKPASNSAKALLVWLHGFSDHCNKYDEFFSVLANHGIAVHSLDQRGWGRSVTRHFERGHTGPRETVLSDITDFVNSLPQTDLPLFLGGHSMGGTQALLWADLARLRTRPAFRGYVISAPFIRFHHSVAPPRIILWLSNLLAPWFPYVKLHSKPRHKSACRGGEVLEDDALCHGCYTLQGLVGMLRTADEVADGLHDLLGTDTETVSLWIGHGDCDEIACYDAARAYFARSHIKDKQFRTYKGCQHDLHLEPGPHKPHFADDVAAWIAERAQATVTAKTDSCSKGDKPPLPMNASQFDDSDGSKKLEELLQ